MLGRVLRGSRLPRAKVEARTLMADAVYQKESSGTRRVVIAEESCECYEIGLLVRTAPNIGNQFLSQL